MELRERLMQSAEWCDAKDSLHERVKHIGGDLRDAVEEIVALDKAYLERVAEANRLQSEVRSLREQVVIAKTEAQDVQRYRDRENNDAQHIRLGMEIAIRCIASGLKGGA